MEHHHKLKIDIEIAISDVRSLSVLNVAKASQSLLRTVTLDEAVDLVNQVTYDNLRNVEGQLRRLGIMESSKCADVPPDSEDAQEEK